MPENEACQFCEKPCDPRGLKAHERACEKNPANMEVSPGTSDAAEAQLEEPVVEEPPKPLPKTPMQDPRREVVDVVLHPAYKTAAEYCRANGIVFETRVQRQTRNGPMTSVKTKTSVPAKIQRGDFAALQAAQKGCVRLA